MHKLWAAATPITSPPVIIILVGIATIRPLVKTVILKHGAAMAITINRQTTHPGEAMTNLLATTIIQIPGVPVEIIISQTMILPTGVAITSPLTETIMRIPGTVVEVTASRAIIPQAGTAITSLLIKTPAVVTRTTSL